MYGVHTRCCLQCCFSLVLLSKVCIPARGVVSGPNRSETAACLLPLKLLLSFMPLPGRGQTTELMLISGGRPLRLDWILTAYCVSKELRVSYKRS